MKKILTILLTLGTGALVATSTLTVISCGVSEIAFNKAKLSEKITDKDLGTIQLETGKNQITTKQLVERINEKNASLNLTEADLETPDFENHSLIKNQVVNLEIFANSSSKKFVGSAIVKFNNLNRLELNLQDSITIQGTNKATDLDEKKVLDKINQDNHLNLKNSVDVDVVLTLDKSSVELIVTSKYANAGDKYLVIINYDDTRPELVIENHEITIEQTNLSLIDKQTVIDAINDANQNLNLNSADVELKINLNYKSAILTVIGDYKNVGEKIAIIINLDTRTNLNTIVTDLGAIKIEDNKDELTTSQLVEAINSANSFEESNKMKVIDLDLINFNDKVEDENGNVSLKISASDYSKTFKGNTTINFSYQLIDVDEVFGNKDLRSQPELKLLNIKEKTFFTYFKVYLKIINPDLDTNELVFDNIWHDENDSSATVWNFDYTIINNSHKYNSDNGSVVFRGTGVKSDLVLNNKLNHEWTMTNTEFLDDGAIIKKFSENNNDFGGTFKELLKELLKVVRNKDTGEVTIIDKDGFFGAIFVGSVKLNIKIEG